MLIFCNRGQQFAIDGTGEINRVVEQGTMVAVQAKFGGIPVYSNKFDLCKELAEVAGGCPFQPSTPKMAKSYVIPKALPKVSLQPHVFHGHMTVF